MSDQKLKVILTGATGMVGEGVLQECLQHPSVEAVLILGRKLLGRTHPKLREIVLPDLFDLTGAAASQSAPSATPSQSSPTGTQSQITASATQPPTAPT